MILRIYRTGEPLALFFLPVLASMLYAFRFLELPVLPEGPSAPLYTLIKPVLYRYPFMGVFTGISLIVWQSVLFSGLLNKQELTSKTAHVPALVYTVIAGGFFHAQGAHPVLFANLFILLALGQLLRVYRQKQVHAEVFNTGFWLGIAALFYWPGTLLLLCVWMGLGIMRTFVWREWLFPLLGFLVPILYAVFWYWWSDATDQWVQRFNVDVFYRSNIFNRKALYEAISIAFVGLILLFSIVLFFRKLIVNIKRVRNLKIILLIFSMGYAGLFVFSFFEMDQTYRPALLAFPVSYFMVFLFEDGKHRVREFLFYLLVLCLFFNSWMAWQVLKSHQ